MEGKKQNKTIFAVLTSVLIIALIGFLILSFPTKTNSENQITDSLPISMVNSVPRNPADPVDDHEDDVSSKAPQTTVTPKPVEENKTPIKGVVDILNNVTVIDNTGKDVSSDNDATPTVVKKADTEEAPPRPQDEDKSDGSSPKQDDQLPIYYGDGSTPTPDNKDDREVIEVEADKTILDDKFNNQVEEDIQNWF